MMSQGELVNALLGTINGARLVTVDAFEGDDAFMIVSAWNGAATVNMVGVYVGTERLEVTGLDIWTNYELPELPIDMVEDRMRATANDALAADAEGTYDDPRNGYDDDGEEATNG